MHLLKDIGPSLALLLITGLRPAQAMPPVGSAHSIIEENFENFVQSVPAQSNAKLKCAPDPLLKILQYDQGVGTWSRLDISRLLNGHAADNCGLPSFKTRPKKFEQMLSSPQSPLQQNAPSNLFTSCLEGTDQTKNAVLAQYYVAMHRLDLGARGALESIASIDEVLGGPLLQGVPAGAGHLEKVAPWHTQIREKCLQGKKTNPLWKKSGATDNMGDIVNFMRAGLQNLSETSKMSRDLYGDEARLATLVHSREYTRRAKNSKTKSALDLVLEDARKMDPQEVTRQLELFEGLKAQWEEAKKGEDTALIEDLGKKVETSSKSLAFVAANLDEKGQLKGKKVCEKPSKRDALAHHADLFGHASPPPSYRLDPVYEKSEVDQALCDDLSQRRASALTTVPLINEIFGKKLLFEADSEEEADKINHHNINVEGMDHLINNPHLIRSALEAYLKDKRKQLVRSYNYFLNGAACINGDICDFSGIQGHVSKFNDESLARYLALQQGLKYAPKLDFTLNSTNPQEPVEESPMHQHFAGKNSHMVSWLKEAQCRQDERLKNLKIVNTTLDAGIGITLFGVTLGTGSLGVLAKTTTKLAASNRLKSISGALRVLNHGNSPKHLLRLKTIGRRADITDGFYAPVGAWAATNECGDLGLEDPIAPSSEVPECSIDPAVRAVKTKARTKYTWCVLNASLNLVPIIQTNAVIRRVWENMRTVPPTP